MTAFEQLKKRAFLFHERTGIDIGMDKNMLFFAHVDGSIAQATRSLDLLDWRIAIGSPDRKIVTESEALRILEGWTGVPFPTAEEVDGILDIMEGDGLT